MIGTRLGQYTIEARLGAGGMGVVYRAFDERLRRIVAIKETLNWLDRFQPLAMPAAHPAKR